MTNVTWFLIIHWWAYGTPVLSIQKFNSEEACKRAGTMIQHDIELEANGNLNSSVRWHCRNDTQT